ncbi:MAG: hypothetical protein ACLSCO_17370 [Gallintestinimicrobium sp.]
MKNKITIVCCYNDRKQYERLQASLAKQNTGYELIGMDNCHGQYASCSLALNAATARVETEYVIYAHQDVELPKEDTLARFAGYLAQTGEADLLGVAGIVPGAIPGRKKYFWRGRGNRFIRSTARRRRTCRSRRAGIFRDEGVRFAG